MGWRESLRQSDWSRRTNSNKTEVVERRFGFGWGPMTVERSDAIERKNGIYRILRINTPTSCTEIYVSPTGKSVRVFRNGKELK